VKFYLRYFFWQWGNERFFDIFLGIKWQALLGLIPPLLGLWGIWHHFKNDKRSFVLIFIAFLVASLGLVTYLNLKYSPSDPRRGDPARGGLGYLEVRERDYFYAFSFVFFTIFVGIGAHTFLRLVADSFRGRKSVVSAAGAALALFSFVPMVLNYATVTRRHNWIPAEYGYNMLLSCSGEKAVIFTNGDNDTFPLWFMQTVPSRIAGYDTTFGKNVAVGILSLLNTSWYCKQLKRWGAPISFSESEIDRLPRAFAGKNNRTFLLEDIMIRDMVATSAGIKLKWPDDYGSTSEEFKAKVFGSGYNPKSPVYFATTVAREKLADVQPFLRLEGLVYRVVPEPGDNQVDLARSYDLLMNRYQMNSMLDPRVHKDDNTRGLFITYAASYLGLSSELRRVGRLKDAEEVLKRAARFDLDPDKRATLFYHLSVSAFENGSLDLALAALDTVKLLGLTNPEFDIQRGVIFEAKGDYRGAEQAYLAAMASGAQRPAPVQSLTRIYLEKLGDTGRARALLEQWLQRMPQDSASARLLRQLS
jgi:tetratricopeptide (TPR) repeat protein